MNLAARALAITAALALLAGCAANARPSWTFAPPAAPPAATGTPPASTPAPAPPQNPGTGIVGQLEFRSYDLGFTPTHPTVHAPGRYEVTLVNDGQVAHDLVFDDGTATPMVAAGQSATITVDIPEGGLGFICSVPGHSVLMSGHVAVSGTGAPDPGPGDPDPNQPGTGVIQPDPAAPPYDLYDPKAPEIMPGEVHEIELVMTEREMTVAQSPEGGFVQKVWTFGDTVPGPVIRVKVGDTIRVRLINPAENGLPHSIDFHSSMVAWNDEMRSINPGEELIYEWRANYAGVWMYHCGTAPALHHIANGMYGMVIVEPVGGLPEVDHEFAFVQSEWYLGPQGQETDLAKAAASAPAPDYVVFNGVANQYLEHPIRVESGERVRAFVLNAGPSVDSSFHIVGTIFDTVIKEGVHLARGNQGSWGSQAVDLSPAQGAIVEFEFAEDGLYPIVTHAFNFVGRGALGLFQSGEVEGDGGGH